MSSRPSRSLQRLPSLPRSFLVSPALSLDRPTQIDPKLPLNKPPAEAANAQTNALLPLISARTLESHLSSSSVTLLHSEVSSRESSLSSMVHYLDQEKKRKELEFHRLSSQLSNNRSSHQSELNSLRSSYQNNLMATEALFLQKEALYLQKQQEIEEKLHQLNDYQIIRDSIIQQLDKTRNMILEKEKQHEKEFFTLEQQFQQEKEALIKEIMEKLNVQTQGNNQGNENGESEFRSRVVSELRSGAQLAKEEFSRASASLASAEGEAGALTKKNEKLKANIKQVERDIELIEQQERLYQGRLAKRSQHVEALQHRNKSSEAELIAAVEQLDEIKAGAESTALTLIEPWQERVAALRRQAEAEERINQERRQQALGLVQERRELTTFFVEFLAKIEAEKKEKQQREEKSSKENLRVNLLKLTKTAGAAKLAETIRTQKREKEENSRKQEEEEEFSLDERERIIRLLYSRVCKVAQPRLPAHSFETPQPQRLLQNTTETEKS